MNKKVLILILLIAALLRLWKLDRVPVSMFGDELDVGYHAYSILKTGKDYSGNTLPLHFQSLAEYRTPLYLYASVPTVAIFGITPYGVRLPAAIFGILGVFGIYLLSNELIKKKFGIWHLKFGILPAMILAISPWHLHYSRAAFEVTMMLFFLLFGLWLFFKSLKGGRLLWISMLCLGLTPWVYSTAKMFVPILIIFLAIVWRRSLLKLPRKQIIYALTSLAVVALPMVYVTFSGQSGQRFSYISVFTDPTTQSDVAYDRLVDAQVRREYGGSFLSKVGTRLFHNNITLQGSKVVNNYLSTFSTSFLFTSGDINLRHSIDQMGQFYKVEAITLLLGAVFFFGKFRNRKIKGLILFWILVGVIPSAITRDGGQHATRLILMLPPTIFLISYGVYYTLTNLKPVYVKVFLISYVGLLVINFLFFQHNYWYHNPWHSERSWHAGYKEVIEGIKEIEDGYEKVILTNAIEPPWIYFIAHYEYSPERLQAGLSDEYVEGFEVLSKLDKFYFGQVGEIGVNALPLVLDDKTVYIAAEREVGENLIIGPEKTPYGLKLVKAVSYPSGEPAFYFFEKSNDFSEEILKERLESKLN